jgi:hypothetical protein
MNINLPTPSDLKKFQIENYSEMLLNPTSEYHEKFLKSQIKLLNENTDILRNCSNNNSSNHNNLVSKKR